MKCVSLMDLKGGNILENGDSMIVEKILRQIYYSSMQIVVAMTNTK